MLPRDKTLEKNLSAVMHLILGRLIHLIIKRQVPQTIWIELHEYEAPKATVSMFSHEQSFKCFMCLYYIQRLLFDQERLQLTNRQLEEEVGRLKVGWATILGRKLQFLDINGFEWQDQK